MKWGGKVQLDTSSSKRLLNTCTIDNFLMTTWCWYKENPGTLSLLRDADSLILREFDAVVSLMLKEHYDEARTILLTMKNDPLSMKGDINSYDADYTYCLSPLMLLYIRSYDMRYVRIFRGRDW